MFLVNLFLPNIIILFPLKTLKNLHFSDIFRGHGDVALATNRLKPTNHLPFSTQCCIKGVKYVQS